MKKNNNRTYRNLDESEHTHTSATEDMSSSSAHWTHTELDLKEFKPPIAAPNSPTPATRLPVMSVQEAMETARQRHVAKLVLIEKLRTINERLDTVLEHCHATKDKLSALEKDYDKLLESDDEVSSDEFTLDSVPESEEDDEISLEDDDSVHSDYSED